MRNDSEFQNFDTTVRKVLSVSHEELQRAARQNRLDDLVGTWKENKQKGA